MIRTNFLGVAHLPRQPRHDSGRDLADLLRLAFAKCRVVLGGKA